MNRRTTRRAVWIALAIAGLLIGGYVVFDQLYYVGKFGVVVPGELYRCRQPHGLQWSVIDRHDIRTVVNLKTEAEDPDVFADERDLLAEKGVKLVHIPIKGLLPSYEQFERFVRSVRNSPRPALVHCEHGRNRTGFMAAAYLIVMQGWSAERAMEDLELYEPWGDEYDAEDAAKRKQLVAMLETIAAERAQWRRRTAPAPEP